MADEESKKLLKGDIKESSKILLANLDNIDGEINRIIDALKKEGISKATIDLSFYSLFNYLDEQDRLLRDLAGIRKRKTPLGTSGKMKVEGKNKK